MQDNEIYQDLLRRAQYAIRSRSRDLVYQTYGEAKMAMRLGAITLLQFLALNYLLVCKGLNDPAHCPLDRGPEDLPGDPNAVTREEAHNG